LLTPGVFTYVNTAVVEALFQIGLYNEEKKQQVFDVFKNVFAKMNEASIDDNLIDSIILARMVSTSITLKFKDLLPHIKNVV